VVRRDGRVVRRLKVSERVVQVDLRGLAAATYRVEVTTRDGGEQRTVTRVYRTGVPSKQ
jgi:hypothetical protein